MFFSAFEELCNRALSFDEGSKNALSNLQGKELNVQTFLEVAGFDFELHWNINFCDNGLIFTVSNDDATLDSDASIRISSFTLFNHLLANKALLESDEILVIGDLTLVNDFQNILSDLDFDWEEPLSYVTGDIVAHELKRLASQIKFPGQKPSAIMESFIEKRVTQYNSSGNVVTDRRRAENKRTGGRRIGDLSVEEKISADMLNTFSEQVGDLKQEQEYLESRINQFFDNLDS